MAADAIRALSDVGDGDGSTLPVFDMPLGRLGAVICWENYMPLLRTAMYAKNMRLWCTPTADGRKTWIPTMQHVALEGRYFVFSCNQFTRRRDFPADYRAIQGDDPQTIVSEGGSCIVSPLGEIVRGKYDFDVVGHYARSDVFRLVVNEQPQVLDLTEKDQALP